MSLSRLERILFVQRSDLIEMQMPTVNQRLKRAFGSELQIDFATKPEDVVVGSAYDALIAPTTDTLPGIMRRLAHLPWIHFLSSGVDRIWDMEFDKRELILTKSAGVHAVPMAEHVLGAMLYFAKGFGRYSADSRIKRWNRRWSSELSSQSVHVLGLGSVGKMVARYSASLGMRVTGTSYTNQPVEHVTSLITLNALPSFLRGKNYLVVCLPLTSETRGMVDVRVLSEIGPGAVLVDVSRGGVVNSTAVLRALESGRLMGAALDVFEEEPLAETSGFWGREDVLVTPHIAGTTPHYLDRALGMFIDAAGSLSRGEDPPTRVDPIRQY